MRTDPTAPWADQVRQLGLRATPGRVAALRYLHDHPHSTAAQVHAGISGELPTVSMQSVHNVVNDLSARGLLRRIDLPGAGAARFETNSEDNHHHIQCVVCGRLEDVECVIGRAPCLTPAEGHGMHTVLAADVMFRAVCTDCATAENTQTTIPTHNQEKTDD
ncbi:Fur family transcriptional regulator [Corynebacterium kalidii]|jgi:Fe2+ or Zn2+ uptake regulation protein